MISSVLTRISRPRFRIYTLGPCLVGIAGSGILRKIHDRPESFSLAGYFFLAFLFFECLSYFTYGSNLFIYGVNDIADGDTDKFNEKKTGYEQSLENTTLSTKQLIHKISTTQLLFFISITVLVFLISIYGGDLGFSIDYRVILGVWGVFLFTGYFYSSKPIRAKSKPFLDGLFNVLYIIPGLFSFLLFGGQRASINRLGFLAGWLWCIAMHTFSAIPDIQADSKAGLTTTAVYFGEKDTLLYCGGLWLRAARVATQALPELGWFFYPAASIYVIMLALCLFFPVMKVYKRFPWINGLIGFLLFWAISFNGVFW